MKDFRVGQDVMVTIDEHWAERGTITLIVGNLATILFPETINLPEHLYGGQMIECQRELDELELPDELAEAVSRRIGATRSRPAACEDCGLNYEVGAADVPVTSSPYTCDDCGGYVDLVAPDTK